MTRAKASAATEASDPNATSSDEPAPAEEPSSETAVETSGAAKSDPETSETTTSDEAAEAVDEVEQVGEAVTTLTFLRTTDGQVVRLEVGDPVPDNADREHVATLRDAGVITGGTGAEDS